jgi:hypothetical protein
MDMRIGVKHRFQRRSHHRGGNGINAAGHALGQNDHVGQDVKMLKTPQFTGPAETGLDLV